MAWGSRIGGVASRMARRPSIGPRQIAASIERCVFDDSDSQVSLAAHIEQGWSARPASATEQGALQPGQR